MTYNVSSGTLNSTIPVSLSVMFKGEGSDAQCQGQ